MIMGIYFFCAFCFGPFGFPIPNEVTILAGAILIANTDLNPWLVYLFLLCGLLCAVTMGYILGSLFGKRFTSRFRKNRYLSKAEELFHKYGSIAICLAYLLPVVRYFIPVLSGINRVSYRKFALLSYTSAFVWTSVYFTVGLLLGNHWLHVPSFVDVESMMIGLFTTYFFFCLVKNLVAIYGNGQSSMSHSRIEKNNG
ncbi:DedA family protein [Paenibacillus roseipurpureus]|uniref:DedA family protein n=1 Tax=Paenibacillus roseopurpureus TaxID=2918901 RepID=A0AA96RJ01_9BACL|nr:DedA family protein [Paenibacillus sp. MBLB1832]WNR43340.1 DedA family protein [Paenibacillus sp. MBLB1832]